MKLWEIRFLGVPCAFQEQQQARLRSKETWAVLASLALPSALRGELLAPIGRTTLADRFWADSETVAPRTHLRQCLSSLRETFGESCLMADRHDVQMTPGWFTTDIGIALSAYQRALRASSLEERLGYLMQAEQEIRGEFFEGWTPDAEETQVWLIHARADVRSKMLPILLLLAETLEVSGNLPAAFDIVRRILQFYAGHRKAREMAWRLAVSTGQQGLLQDLGRIQNFREAVSRFPPDGLNAASLREGRLFRSLFDAEFNSLSPNLRRAILRLSVLPTVFSLAVAESVCRISRPLLEALTQTPFLRQEADTFAFPACVRDCAWLLLPTATRQLLQKRLALFCVEAMTNSPLSADTMPASLGPTELARPLLQQALGWILEQEPDSRYVLFLNLLRYRGLNDLAMEGIRYQYRVLESPSSPPEMRYYAGIYAAYSLMHAGDHAAAVSPLETILEIATDLRNNDGLGDVHSTLMMCYGNMGEWQKASQHGIQARKQYQLSRHRRAEAHCIRFQAELDFLAGQLDVALQGCNETLRLRRAEACGPGDLADALYWRARILHALKRWGEAEEAVEEALSLWQEDGDTKVGLCLCVMAQIDMGMGRLAEARSHLNHAISLHQRTPMERHRIAALEILGDVWLAMQRVEEARACYLECLRFYTERQHGPSIAHLQAKLQACPPLL